VAIYEPPYSPEDLKEPALDGEAFLELLHAEQARKYPDPPPLYQELYAGRLRKEDLQLWVKDMYSYWDHGLVYSTGAIFVKTNDEETRTHILRKLVDLEGEEVVHDLTGWTTPAYEELWLRFGEGLGLRREEVLSWKPFTRTHYANTTLCMLSRWWEWTWLDGIASLYAGDLHGQRYLGEAHEALQQHYSVPADSLEFFRVYLADVATHIPWEAEALKYWCCTRERQLTAAKAFRYRLDIENQLLVRVHTAATTGELPLQVP
jgi:pyrroloquinoline quinone (PQQ) biosynthesis protein C